MTGCGPRPAIKLMTDGILLAEIQQDRLLHGIRHPHHRRGPRARSQHRLSARLSARPPAATPGSQGHRHLGDHRPAALCPPFRGCRGPAGAHHRDLRPHLSGRGALSAARGGERRRARRRHAAGDLGCGERPGADRQRRRAGLSLRRARDPRDRRDPAQASSALDRDPAALRPPGSAGAGAHLPVARHAAGGAGDQCRRDLAHGARHPLRDRPRLRAHQPLQSSHQGPAAAGRAHLPGQRQPAQGPLRAGRGRGLHPAVQRGQLPGARRLHRARDRAHQPGLGHPADEAARLRGHRALSLHRSAGLPADRGRLPHPRRAGGDRRQGRADPARAASSRVCRSIRASGACCSRPPSWAVWPRCWSSPPRSACRIRAIARSTNSRRPTRSTPPSPIRTRISRLPQSLALPGEGARRPLAQQVHQALSAPLPVLEPGAGVARHPCPVARADAGDGVSVVSRQPSAASDGRPAGGWRLEAGGRHLRQDPSRPADRPARQHRLPRGGARIPGGAQQPLLHPSQLGALRQAAQVGDGRGAGRDHAPVRAHRRPAIQPAWIEERWPASAPAQLLGAALAGQVRSGRGLRAGDPLSA